MGEYRMITLKEEAKNYNELYNLNKDLFEFNINEKTISQTYRDIEKDMVKSIFTLLWKYKKDKSKSIFLIKNKNNNADNKYIHFSSIGIGSNWSQHSNNYPAEHLFSGEYNDGIYELIIKNNYTDLMNLLNDTGKNILTTIKEVFDNHQLKNYSNYETIINIGHPEKMKYFYNNISDINIRLYEWNNKFNIIFNARQKEMGINELINLNYINNEDRFKQHISLIVINENRDNILKIKDNYKNDLVKIKAELNNFYNEFNEKLSPYLVALSL
jgi:hypothetical protein